ncbi:outer membrane beta-barrel family protein [Taibaiella koreensis]|uniref:outer membrane beta-barrel family protein n=1 Tax=Taibaiella koreensis TaxID=1268548 RepID=UPI000E59D68B|nr:outer membrane beta-barrel family protein [Taibaiella koreensis]
MHPLKWLLCRALPLLLCYTTNAQQVLSGKVSDKKGALAFATVLLHDGRDSSLLLPPVFTDSNGVFSLSLPDPQPSCFIEISLLGYKPFFKSVPASGPISTPMQVVLESDGALLEDVVISGKKALIERKPDRTIFNAEQSIGAVGSDVYELLKKTPGVQVSSDGIKIVGKSTVNVMVNDRPVQLTNEELESMLRSMPSGDVSRIEVITAPPAKYDAEGNSGIINIVTKKKRANGFNSTLTGTYEQRTRPAFEAEGLFNYRQGRLNAYATLSGARNRYVSQQQTNTFYPGQEQALMLNQDNRPAYTYSQAGIDYDVRDNMTLGVQYTHGTLDAKRDEQIRINVWQRPGQQLDSTMNTDAFATEKAVRNVINLNYDWKLDSSGHRLTLNAEYFERRSDKTRNFTTGNFFTDGTATGTSSDNHTGGMQRTRITNVRADLEWPTKLATFSTGAKVTFIRNNSDNRFEYLERPVYVTDPGKTNSFDYQENTQALYASAQRSWGKWHMQAGLRAEYTQTQGFSQTINQTNTNDYLKFFPSAYLQYQPNETHSWNINYTRRINRPSFWSMNPFRVYSTATAYEQGNPFLQPSFSNNIELGYTYKSMLTISAFFQKVDAFATRVSAIDTINSTFFFFQANAGNEIQFGFNASLTFNPLPFWETSTQFFGVYNRFHTTYYNTGQPGSGRPAFSLETDHTFTLNRSKTLMAQIHGNYYGKAQDDVDIQSAGGSFDIGMKVLLFRKKITVSAYVSDLFRTDIVAFVNAYNGTYQHRYFDSRSLRIALSWKFGNNDLKARKERKANEDTRRAG